MNEVAQLTKRRLLLLSKIGKAADEISRIDSRLNSIPHEMDGADPDNIEARP